MTSARLCIGDQDGPEPTSANASRIPSGGASMTTSRDACTATTSKLATQSHLRTAFAQPCGRSKMFSGRAARSLLLREISVDERPAVQQLGWTDDMMLRAETPETPLQIQMLLIYDPSTAPGGRVTFKGILEELDARLHLAEVFRRRLTETPAGLDRPYWVDDPNFDLEYHVRHIGLPQPGDWRQLCIQVARLHGRQIDLRRPPWEITVIEGLNAIPGVPKGSFAMALKLHHCAVDGMASVQMIAAMHDLAADVPRPAAPDKRWNPAPLPTTADLLSRTAIKTALYPVRAGTVLASSVPKVARGLAGLPVKLIRGVSRVAEVGAPSFPPKTRFNETVSPHRVF